MSYIVPRDKPKRCTQPRCRFMDRDTLNCRLQDKSWESFEEQYEHCPLIEVPIPHGRLIDADAVNRKMDERIETMKDDASIYEASCVATALEMFAPTVIEAEE